MTQQYILILSIGPVQNFIAEARRTADLYAGSRILMELARAIVQAIKSNRGELIYPASLEADMPNKIVGIVDSPSQMAQIARAALNTHWQQFGDTAMEKLFDTDDKTLQEIWRRQFYQHLEFYWVAVPLNGNYQEAYKLADRAFGARKQTRNFDQVIEDGFKDSLSGTRSALRRRRDKDARQYWAELRKLKRNARQLQEGELLDTLAVIKRFGVDKRFRFPSTSTVASASFIKNCPAEAKDKFVQAIEEYNQKVKNIPQDYRFQEGVDIPGENYHYQQENGYFHKVDDFERNFKYGGDLLYLEGYERLAENYGDEPPSDVTPIKKALEELYKAAQKLPSPYYAILQMDGDLMGKHVSKCTKRREHEQLGEDLDAFTKTAVNLVKGRNGYLIYAGGDDVLALFPADSALSAAQDLSQAYLKQFQAWQQHDDDEKAFPFTVSVGIAFAHYLDPLDLVLRTAREAEKRAKNKNQYDRAALVVTILRRSGETLEVGGKWKVNDTLTTVGIVNELCGLFENEEISSRFPYNVLREAEVVTKLGHDGQKAMLKLLLARASNQKARFNSTKLLNNWVVWAEAHNNWTLPDPDSPEDNSIKNQGYLELARWFVVARWLTGGGRE